MFPEGTRTRRFVEDIEKTREIDEVRKDIHREMEVLNEEKITYMNYNKFSDKIEKILGGLDKSGESLLLEVGGIKAELDKVINSDEFRMESFHDNPFFTYFKSAYQAMIMLSRGVLPYTTLMIEVMDLREKKAKEVIQNIEDLSEAKIMAKSNKELYENMTKSYLDLYNTSTEHDKLLLERNYAVFKETVNQIQEKYNELIMQIKSSDKFDRETFKLNKEYDDVRRERDTLKEKLNIIRGELTPSTKLITPEEEISDISVHEAQINHKEEVEEPVEMPPQKGGVAIKINWDEVDIPNGTNKSKFESFQRDINNILSGTSKQSVACIQNRKFNLSNKHDLDINTISSILSQVKEQGMKQIRKLEGEI